jgi:hypothetical protein
MKETIHLLCAQELTPQMLNILKKQTVKFSLKGYLAGNLDKIKLSLCLIKHYAMKTYGGVDVQVHTLTSALVGGE